MPAPETSQTLTSFRGQETPFGNFARVFPFRYPCFSSQGNKEEHGDFINKWMGEVLARANKDKLGMILFCIGVVSEGGFRGYVNLWTCSIPEFRS